MNYYNDTDPYVCDWLAALIQAQLIPPGHIDRRPIQDVRPYELAPFTQCHFFAGIAGWPSALALAGVGPDRPLWTGSCPCQPFSQAGKGRGFDDERHLWPYWHHLIAQCRPPIVFGEQVASPDGLDWVDLVQDDMEDQDYAFGKSDICAAGVGAPHIRQRLYFVALADGGDAGSERQQRSRQHGQQSQNGFVGGFVADPSSTGWRPHVRAGEACNGPRQVEFDGRGDAGELADPGAQRVRAPGCRADQQTSSGVQDTNGQWERFWIDIGSSGSSATSNVGHPALNGIGPHHRQSEQSPQREIEAGGSGIFEQLGHPGSEGLARRSRQRSHDGAQFETAERAGGSVGGMEHAESEQVGLPGLARELRSSFWSLCDWLPCTDGKSRPVEPGTFPLAHGVPARVAKLRALGNAIVPQVAAMFIKAALGT